MEALVIVAIVIFTAMVLLFVVLTFVSCLKYNTTEISAAPATFDGLVSGDAPAEALAPKTSDQGSRRSLASYFSKSSSNTVTGNTTKDRGSRRSLASYFSALSSRSVIGGSAEKTKEASNPIEDEEPRRRRRELPQYASKGSLESWRQAPPPAYVSTKKAVGGESTPPPAYVSMKAFMPNESSEAEDSHEDHSWHLAAARQSPNPTQDRAEDSTPKPAKDAVTDGDVLPIASPREESSSAPAGSCGVKASNEGNRETGSARADDAANARLSTFGHGSAEKTTVSVDGQESQMDSSAASVDLRRKSSVNFVLSTPGKLSGSSAGSVEAAGLEGSTPTDVTMSLFSSSYSTGKNWKGDLHNISFKTGPDKYVPSDASSSGSEDA
eukprot:g1679.t1